MGEKGGKGFSLNSNFGKSSIKSLEGKDGSAVKSKRGRKPLNNGGLPEARPAGSPLFGSSEKTNITTVKGDMSKGGKGGRVLSGEKSGIPKPPAPLELRIEQELPKNAKCMMNCEAAFLLKGIQEQMTVLSQDPTIKIPLSFDKGLQYAESSNCYASPQSVRRVLEYPLFYFHGHLYLKDNKPFIAFAIFHLMPPLKLNPNIRTLSKHGVSDGEICVIANTCSETIDEVFALVPSLKPKWSELREPLKDVLQELAQLKQANQSPSPGRYPGFS